MSVRSITRLIAGVASVLGATVTGGLWFMSSGADVMAMMQGKAAPASAPAAPAPSPPQTQAASTIANRGEDAVMPEELDRCTVNDPSPTALNVRSKPNGDVIGHLSNGVTVRVLRRDAVNGKAWALIEPVSGRGETGWAFARYLDCDGSE